MSSNNANNNNNNIHNNRRYLCQAPRPDTWDEYADTVLQNLGATNEDREAALVQTLAIARKRNPFTPRTGPGRKTNTEHAIFFYQHILERLKNGNFVPDDTKQLPEEEVYVEVEVTNEETSPDSDETKNTAPPGQQLQPTETAITAAPSNKTNTRTEEESSMDTAEFNAQHNDICEVCDKPGDLLMCSTCNLSFHVTCSRPVLEEVPTDPNWRCSYCVLSTSAKNTKPRRVAAAAVRMMARLRNKNIRQERQNLALLQKERTETEDTKESNPSRVTGDPASPEDSPGARSRRARKQPVLYDPQSGPAREWQTDELLEWKVMMSERRNESEDDDDADDEGGQDKGEGQDNAKGESSATHHAQAVDAKPRVRAGLSSLFCNFCQDDPNIKVCVFCACRVCFGKHHQTRLLLCDRCDDEYHTFCLNPPLQSIPRSKWFCPSCKETAERRLARSVTRVETRGSPRNNASAPRRSSGRKIIPISRGDSPEPVADEMRRKRGRPAKNVPPKVIPPTTVGKKRGRPAKQTLDLLQPPGKRGRPPKSKSPTDGGEGEMQFPEDADVVMRDESGVPLPVTVSRSGRTVRRSSFHDEIQEGEQHLRASRSTEEVASVSRNLSGPEEGSSNDTFGTAVPIPVTTGASARVDLSKASSAAAEPTRAPLSPGVSAPIVLPQIPTNAGISTTSIAMTTVDVGREAKVPRRKPGARECMQISRRFGVDVIPSQYMEILLDYCKRGKVEHLIRMRERLDEHARFLEFQLAGLNAMVQQKQKAKDKLAQKAAAAAAATVTSTAAQTETTSTTETTVAAQPATEDAPAEEAKATTPEPQDETIRVETQPEDNEANAQKLQSTTASQSMVVDS